MCNYPVENQTPATDGYKQYEKQHGEDHIVLIGPQHMTLEPWIRTDQKSSSNPQVARNGDVLFISRTNSLDSSKDTHYNYDLFLKQGTSLNRLTQLHTYLHGIAISPDSHYVAYLSDPKRDHNDSLWLMNLDTSEQIQIPITDSLTRIEQLPVKLISEQISR